MKHEWDDSSVFGFPVCKRCCRVRNEHNAEKECKAVGLRVGQQYNAHVPKPPPTPEEREKGRKALARMALYGFAASAALRAVGTPEDEITKALEER